jgi:hypothetical protein
MITAPSTTMPKSMAPRLIRLADTPKMRIMMMANSMASGMTEATTNPARRLPSISTRTKMTMRPPSIRFLVTVPMVLPTSTERSR